MATLNETHEKIEVKDLIEFNQEKRVRKKLFQSQKIVSELVCYEPGQHTVLHEHPKQDEIFYIIEGRGSILFEDEEKPIAERDMVFVPAGVKHGFRTDEDSRLVVLFSKAPGIPPRGRD